MEDDDIQQMVAQIAQKYGGRPPMQPGMQQAFSGQSGVQMPPHGQQPPMPPGAAQSMNGQQPPQAHPMEGQFAQAAQQIAQKYAKPGYSAQMPPWQHHPDPSGGPGAFRTPQYPPDQHGPGGPPQPMTQTQQGQMQQVPGYGQVQGGLDMKAPGGPSINMKGLAGAQQASFVPTGTTGLPNRNWGQSGGAPAQFGGQSTPQGQQQTSVAPKKAELPQPPVPPPYPTKQQAAVLSHQYGITPDKAVKMLEEVNNHDFENRMKQYTAEIHQHAAQTTAERAVKAKNIVEFNQAMKMHDELVKMIGKPELAGKEIETGKQIPNTGWFGEKTVPEKVTQGSIWQKQADEEWAKAQKIRGGAGAGPIETGNGDEPQSEDAVPKEDTIEVGTVRKGYRFMGGDPSDKDSWEKDGG